MGCATLERSGGVAVITGAGSGIGRAIALALAARSMPCCLVGKTLSKLQDVAQLANAVGVEAIPIALDVRDPGAGAMLAERLTFLERPIELLVHSAGVMRLARIEEATVEQFTKVLAVNVIAPFTITKYLLDKICASRGQIVFINSSILQNPSAGTALYAASKHALKGLADALRQEVNSKGVRVTSVYPGRTATPLQASVFQTEGRQYLPENLLQPEDVAEAVVNAIALPSTAEITEIMIRPAKAHSIHFEHQNLK
jgi:NADP-dependent 3-hydroxy acid dehydrogenase YdfG